MLFCCIRPRILGSNLKLVKLSESSMQTPTELRILERLSQAFAYPAKIPLLVSLMARICDKPFKKFLWDYFNVL